MILAAVKNHLPLSDLFTGIGTYLQTIFRPVIDQECPIHQRFRPGRANGQNFLSLWFDDQKALRLNSLVLIESSRGPAFSVPLDFFDSGRQAPFNRGRFQVQQDDQ